MDGAGDLDLITGNQSEANRVYLSNGNGTFATGNDVDTQSLRTYSVQLGDLDGDGDLDLVTGNRNQTNLLYLSNGKDLWLEAARAEGEPIPEPKYRPLIYQTPSV